MRVWFLACLLINGTDWVWQIDRSSLTVTAILPRRGFPRPGRFVRREINPREVQDRCRNPGGPGTLGEVAQRVFAFSGAAADI